MSDFRIIPVIDILNSVVVHAIKGEREKYQPLKTKMIDSSNPLALLKHLSDFYKFREFYIADLDALINRKPNTKLLEEILEILDISVMLDPGINKVEEIELYSEIKLSKIILGLETIENYEVIKNGLTKYGSDKIIVSIDMYNEKIVAKNINLKSKDPKEIVETIRRIGVKEIILLDLLRVGQKLGGIPSLYQEIRNIFKGNILVGGGIKDFKDIHLYYKNNFSGVLIATALYDGTLKLEHITNFKNF